MDDCRKLPGLQDINIPFYVQIYDIVYELIRNGHLKEGDTLPGENVLAAYWNVSRSTIRMAVRKLEEDGLIYKMQGRKTTVTGQMARNKTGISQIINPCVACCQKEITRKESRLSIQNGGKLVSDLLGLERETFVALAVDIMYFVGEEHVASSVTVIPVLELEKAGIAIDDKESIEAFVLNTLYEKAKFSSLSMSAIEGAEEETDKPKTPILVVMDEVLGEGERPISYHKYWMDGNWYRFSLERKK